MWSLASSAFGRWETPTFLAFPGLPRPRSLTRFNIMPVTLFLTFLAGDNFALTYCEMKKHYFY